jgi:hypothetical protein
VKKQVRALWVVLVFLAAMPAVAREICMKAGCKDKGCMNGLPFPNGEIGYGRLFDCCDPGGRGWYAIVTNCQGQPWPKWWDRWWLDVHVPYEWTFESGFRQFDWKYDVAYVDLGFHAPPISVGDAKVDPVFRAGVGRANLSFDAGERDPIRFRGSGTLLTTGMEATVEPCAKCAWTLKADVRYQTLRDPDRYDYRIDGIAASSKIDYSAVDTGIALRYAFLAGRLRPGIGVRHTNADARIETIFAYALSARPDLDRTEVVGGLDIVIGRSFTGRLEYAADSDRRRASVSLGYHFAPWHRSAAASENQTFSSFVTPHVRCP